MSNTRGRSGTSRHFIKAVAALLLTLAVLPLSACGGDGDSDDGAAAPSTGEKAEKHLTIGIYTPLRDYGLAMVEGAEKAATEGNASILKFDPKDNPQVQLQQCQDAITAKKQNGLLVYPTDGQAALICAKQAKEAGIPVVGVGLLPFGPNSDATELQTDDIVGQVVFNTKQDAQVAISLLKKACADKDPCKVVYFEGLPQVAYSANRLKYVKQLLKESPTIKLLDVVVAGLTDPDKGEATARSVLAKHGDADVFMNDDDTTMSGMVRAVQAAGKGDQIKLIGDGANKLGWKNIKDGKQWGTVISMPTTQTKAGAEMLIKAIRGEKIADNNIDVASLSPIGTLELTAENVDQFTPEY